MFKTILLAASADHACDNAAKSAFRLADLTNAHITVFHVLGMPAHGFSQEVIDVKTGEKVEASEEYISWVKEEIKIYYAKQFEKTKSFDIKIAVGMPYREILREIKNGRYDIVTLGGTSKEKISVYKKHMLGSTVLRVAKASPIPVMVLCRPSSSFLKNISSILFCADFSKESDAAFNFAANLAKFFNCNLDIFNVADISPVFSKNIIEQDEIDSQISAAYKKIEEKYIPHTKNIIKTVANVCEGIPYVEIVKYAREKNSSLIVIAHHNKENENFGSNMEQIIVRSASPVISINK
ncbi:MAG: universal stress protein [Deltaproteobacteria bacterium]|nr:universal stress protein [Deltaproteobacteria bacterium]